MVNTIQPGSRVTLHYELPLGDEAVVDSPRAGEPATFLMGGGELIELLEKRLLGLRPGERRHFAISAAESQTAVSAETVQTMARSDFPADLALETGRGLGFVRASG